MVGTSESLIQSLKLGLRLCAAARLGILYTMRERKINELNM